MVRSPLEHGAVVRMEVTDMILDIAELETPDGLIEVTLARPTGGGRAEVLAFVRSEFGRFLRYYESPGPDTDVYAIASQERMIGTVLLERKPKAAVTQTDGALACLVIGQRWRRSGFGSAAVVASSRELERMGFQRVIAEWVASIGLYQRLGFRVWRTREITSG
jgi:hypothetical protein